MISALQEESQSLAGSQEPSTILQFSALLSTEAAPARLHFLTTRALVGRLSIPTKAHAHSATARTSTSLSQAMPRRLALTELFSLGSGITRSGIARFTCLVPPSQ